LKLFRDRTDSGNLFQTDGEQQLKACLPNSDDNVGNASRFCYLTEGIEWVDTAEVADAGRLVVLLAVIYRY